LLHGAAVMLRDVAVRVLSLVCLAAALLWCGRASASDAVSVRELLARAELLAARVHRASPAVGEAQARVEQSESQVGVSGVLPNPVLTLSLGGIPTAARNPDWLPWRESLNLGLGVAQTFELAKRGARIRAARLGAASEAAGLQAVEAEQIAASREVLARITWLSERAALLAERLATARRVVELERVRLQKGEISGVDHDRLVLEAAAAERDTSDNAALLEASLADCAVLLDARCVPDASMQAVQQSAPLPADADWERLVAARADVRSLRLAVDAARGEATAHERRRIPDPTVGVTYTRDWLVYGGNQPHTVMLWTSVPVPLFDRGQHQARQARGKATELGHRLQATERRALEDLRELRARRQLLDAKLATLLNLALPRAQVALQGGEEAYKLGQISLTDLLLLRRELPALLLAHVDTRYEQLLVRNKLRLVLGLDTPRPGGQQP
jgi:cobalt-zinc-cadmium efflux system outer membrane protein